MSELYLSQVLSSLQEYGEGADDEAANIEDFHLPYGPDTQPNFGGERILYLTDEGRADFLASPTDLQDTVKTSCRTTLRQVCVIQNISAACIGKIGPDWNIDPYFFAKHIANPDHRTVWRARSGWDSTHELRASKQHLIGIYEFHNIAFDGKQSSQPYRDRPTNVVRRPIWRHGRWPACKIAKMSYCAVDDNLVLFLVDDPLYMDNSSSLKLGHPASHITLRFPYSRQYGGILIPPLRLSETCVLIDALKSMFHHGWIFRLMFHKEGVLPKVPFLYVMAYSLWETKLAGISDDVKHISFEEIRKPSMAVTDKLHDLRKELSELRENIATTLRYMNVGVVAYYRAQNLSPHDTTYPVNRLEDVLRRSETVYALVVETFQLLTSTIAVVEGQAGLRQASSALLLTRLAAVYLPLSLTVGVFGMNLSELNSSGQPVWVFVVACVVVSFLTALGWYGFSIFGVLRQLLFVRIPRAGWLLRDVYHNVRRGMLR